MGTKIECLGWINKHIIKTRTSSSLSPACKAVAAGPSGKTLVIKIPWRKIKSVGRDDLLLGALILMDFSFFSSFKKTCLSLWERSYLLSTRKFLPAK